MPGRGHRVAQFYIDRLYEQDVDFADLIAGYPSWRIETLNRNSMSKTEQGKDAASRISGSLPLKSNHPK